MLATRKSYPKPRLQPAASPGTACGVTVGHGSCWQSAPVSVPPWPGTAGRAPLAPQGWGQVITEPGFRF